MDWIDLVQDRNRWRAVVNAVMNLQVSYRPLHTCNTVTYQKLLRCYLTGLFGAMSVFGRHIKEMLQLRPEQVFDGTPCRNT